VVATFNDLYKQFRNRLRPYKPFSILRAALTTLRAKSGDKLQDLKMAPWQVLLIVKWALQDKMAEDIGGRDISQLQFDGIRQKLYEFAEYMRSVPGLPLPLFFRRHVHQQIAFQREMSGGFVREAAMLGTLAEEHPLRQQFQARAGITPELFMDLALSTYPAIVLDNRMSLPFRWFSPLARIVGGASLESFYTLVARDYSQLRRFCRALPDQNPRVASEYFESTPLRRFPFFRHGDGLECWHEMVFFRGMEGMVHSVLSEAGKAYIEPFSKLFESHVAREAFSAEFPSMNEDALRSLLGRDSKVPDALLSFPEANVLIEAKAGLFDESVMTIGNIQILSDRTKALREAIKQGWAASSVLRKTEAAPVQVRNAPIDYLLVVTNRDLETGRGTHLKEMYPDGKLAYPNAESAQFLPLERVYILSVEEFERLMSAVRQREVYLPKVLADCVEADAQPTSAKYFFEQHLTAQKIRLGRSDLVNRALDRSEERVATALSQNE
jgi:hypothetical protein